MLPSNATSKYWQSRSLFRIDNAQVSAHALANFWLFPTNHGRRSHALFLFLFAKIPLSAQAMRFLNPSRLSFVPSQTQTTTLKQSLTPCDHANAHFPLTELHWAHSRDCTSRILVPQQYAWCCPDEVDRIAHLTSLVLRKITYCQHPHSY